LLCSESSNGQVGWACQEFDRAILFTDCCAKIAVDAERRRVRAPCSLVVLFLGHDSPPGKCKLRKRRKKSKRYFVMNDGLNSSLCLTPEQGDRKLRTLHLCVRPIHLPQRIANFTYSRVRLVTASMMLAGFATRHSHSTQPAVLGGGFSERVPDVGDFVIRTPLRKGGELGDCCRAMLSSI